MLSTGLVVHNRLLVLQLLVAILFMICSSSSVQALEGPAPAPEESGGYLMSPSAAAPTGGLDCTNQLLNLSSCLTFVEQGSSLPVPDKGCCPSFASLVNNQPLCLCQLLANSNSFGIQIDTTKALDLPTSCHVDTPPVTLCADFGIPVASPMGPSPSPASLVPGMAPEGAPSALTSTAGISAKAISMVIVAAAAAGYLSIAAFFF